MVTSFDELRLIRKQLEETNKILSQFLTKTEALKLPTQTQLIDGILELLQKLSMSDGEKHP